MTIDSLPIRHLELGRTRVLMVKTGCILLAVEKFLKVDLGP